MGNQETSLSWSEWKVTKRLLYLGNLRRLPTKDQSLRLDFEWLVLCCSTILRCVIFLSLFLDLNLLFRKETHWFFVVLWIFFFCYHLFFFFFFFFKIWNLKFSLKGVALCSWSSLKIYFSSFKIENFFKLIPSVFKIFEKPLLPCSFFWWVDWVNLVKPQLTQQLECDKKGGGGGLIFGPLYACLHFFFFFYSLFFLHCYYSQASSSSIFFIRTPFLP